MMKEDFNFNYPVILIQQPEGGYLVEFPDFPEAITQGETKEEALQEAADCLEEAIANRIVMELDIPLKVHHKHYADFVCLHITLAAKCALYLAMKKQECKKVALAKMLKCDEKEVRRLLDPRYKSKISRIEEALDCLGKKLTLSVTPAEYSTIGQNFSGFSPKKPSGTNYHQST